MIFFIGRSTAALLVVLSVGLNLYIYDVIAASAPQIVANIVFAVLMLITFCSALRCFVFHDLKARLANLTRNVGTYTYTLVDTGMEIRVDKNLGPIYQISKITPGNKLELMYTIAPSYLRAETQGGASSVLMGTIFRLMTMIPKSRDTITATAP